jgi:hypothetical protein
VSNGWVRVHYGLRSLGAKTASGELKRTIYEDIVASINREIQG